MLGVKGFSYRKLANEMGVPEQTVIDWIANKKQPSIKSLYRIAEILKIHARELLA
jgi:transcriptional regulator with XRE-family HTH domain